MTSDPQVPGPGLRRPAPKKVASSVAHRGALDPESELDLAAATKLVDELSFSFLIRTILTYGFFGVGDGR